MVVLREAVVEISGGPAEGDGAGEHGPEREHQDDGERPVLVAAAAEGGGIRRTVLPQRRRRRRREGHRRRRSGRGHGQHVIVSHNYIQTNAGNNLRLKIRDQIVAASISIMARIEK